MEIDFIVPPWGNNPEVAQLTKVAWEDLGITVNLRVAPGFGPLKEIQSSGEYHSIGLNFFGTDPDLLCSFYHSEGYYNWSGLQDPELDRQLLTASQQSTDPLARWELYNDILTEIVESGVVLPIREYVNLVVASGELAGLHFSAQGWFPLLIDLHYDY